MASNPIKEIILSVSFQSSVEPDKLEMFYNHPTIKKAFHIIKDGYKAEVTLGKEIKGDVKRSGVVLETNTDPRKRLLINESRLSLHIFKKYIPFPELLDELDIYWSIFKETLGLLKVNAITARYINDIIMEEGKLPSDYINVQLTPPFKHESVTERLVYFKIKPETELEDVLANVIVVNKNTNSLILDISVQRKSVAEDFKNLSDLFIGLRPVKNNIFKEMITETTQEVFHYE